MFLTKENGMRIVEEIKETIGRDVNIMDRTGTILASTDPKRIGQLHTIAKEILEQQLPVLEVAAGEEGPGAQQGVNLPIYVDGNCEGVIGITGPPDAVRDFGAIVKKMTEILLTTMRQQEQSLLVEQARSLFLEEWLFAQNLDWSAFAERGALLDIDIREPKRIAILEYEPRGTAQPPELHGGRLLQMAQRYVQGEQTLCAVVNRRLLLVFGPEQKALEVLKQFQQAAESFYEVTLSGGLSSLSRGAEDIRRCYNEAKIAARAAAKNHTILEYSGISLDFVLQNLEPKVKADVCRAIFETVPEDEREELLECLVLYFRCEGNVERAAQSIHVHKNTFRYRMGKLAQYTGYDLRRPRDAAMLYIAMQFLDAERNSFPGGNNQQK